MPLYIRLSGRLGFLSDQHKATLKEMRIKANDAHTAASQLSDEDLLRFLRARGWDVTRALAMLVAYLKWRETFYGGHVDGLVDRVMSGEIQREMMMGRGFLSYHTRWGQPMIYMLPRNHQFGANEDEIVDCLKYGTSFLELTQSRMLQAPSDQICFVWDYEGYDYSLDIKMIPRAIKIFQDGYPERLAAVFLLNFSTAFWVMYKVLEPLLDPAVVAKVIWVQPDQRQLFLRHFRPEHVPAAIGGSNTFWDRWKERPQEELFGVKDDSDRAECVQSVRNWLSRFEQFRHKGDEGLKVEKMQIVAGADSRLRMEFPGTTEQTPTLFWRARVAEKDIGLYIEFQPGSSEGGADSVVHEAAPIILVENRRFSGEQRGIVPLPGDPGVIEVVLDNTHSWLNAKDVDFAWGVVF